MKDYVYTCDVCGEKMSLPHYVISELLGANQEKITVCVEGHRGGGEPIDMCRGCIKVALRQGIPCEK